MTNRYDDILYLPHKQSDARQRMSRASRAAQFAPFAALVGYGDALNETMRKTEEKIDLSDDQIDGLNFKIAYLGAHIDEEPEVTITFFVKDKRKSGGAYITVTGSIDEIDEYERTIIMSKIYRTVYLGQGRVQMRSRRFEVEWLHFHLRFLRRADLRSYA